MLPESFANLKSDYDAALKKLKKATSEEEKLKLLATLRGFINQAEAMIAESQENRHATRVLPSSRRSESALQRSLDHQTNKHRSEGKAHETDYKDF